MPSKTDAIQALEDIQKDAQDKIDMINSLEQGKCYRFIMNEYMWYLGILDGYGADSFHIAVMAIPQKNSSHLYTQYLYFISIRSFEEVTMKDLPLYVNEHTTNFYNQVLAGEPLKVGNQLMKIPYDIS